jgi:Mg2+-importing ATPase
MTPAYWSRTVDDLQQQVQSGPAGLSAAQAALRLARDAHNSLDTQPRTSAAGLLFSQFKSPLVVILIVAAIISLVAGEWIDASVVLAIVLGSTLLGFAQEFIAGNAIDKLRSQVLIHSSVLRDAQVSVQSSGTVVQGDVVLLSAGSLIPADGVVLSAKDFFINQAVLTGETFPVEKKPGQVSADASLSERSNCVFMGTSVSSGTARMLVVQTGKATVFGQIAGKLALRPPLTEFERGVQRFGFLLTRIMLVMVVVVLAINMLMHKPPMDSLLFLSLIHI